MRGIPQIEVTFDIDANGIVNVHAKDLGTGKEQKITITSSTNMSKEDIEKAVKNAEQFAAEDKKRREEVDAKNEAENLCYAIEKLLNENGDKIDQADKDSLNEKVKKLKETITSGNIDSIKSETESLQKAMYEVSAKLYQNAQAAQQAAPNAATCAEGQTNDSANGNVYDADFKDVDNK